MLKLIFPGMIAWVLTTPLVASPVELTLAAGGGFDVTYSLSTGQSTTGRDDLSGRILADVRVNEFEGVSWFKMSGGRIAHSDGTLDLALSSFVHVLFITQGVASLPMTEEGGGFVNWTTGVAINGGHRMISNEGVATTRYVVFGSTAGEEVRNLANQPDNTALVGTTTLTATVLASSPWWKRCRIDLYHQRNEGRTFPVTGTTLVPPGTTYTVHENGSFTASGEGVFPGNDFVAWAQTFRNVSPTGFVDLDPATGQPLLVMYALGAEDGAWSLPVVIEPALSRVVVQLPSATKAPVQWEFSGDLGEGTWLPLPGGLIPAGATGDQVLTLPPGTRGFLRASVPEP